MTPEELLSKQIDFSNFLLSKNKKEKVYPHQQWMDKEGDSEKELCAFLGCDFVLLLILNVKELFE